MPRIDKNVILPWEEEAVYHVVYQNMSMVEAAKMVGKSYRTVQGKMSEPRLRKYLKKIREEKLRKIIEPAKDRIVECIETAYETLVDIMKLQPGDNLDMKSLVAIKYKAAIKVLEGTGKLNAHNEEDDKSNLPLQQNFVIAIPDKRTNEDYGGKDVTDSISESDAALEAATKTKDST